MPHPMDPAPANPQVDIVTLTRQPHHIKRFLRVPGPLYAQHPNWIAPLELDLAKVFTDTNPLLQHAEIQLWIARQNHHDVGRIAGIIDHHHRQYQHDNAAFFGFFESSPDFAVAQTLFHTVRTWARQKGHDRLLGPVNPTTNDECGLLIHGFDSPPVFMMPYNPPYYIDHLEKAGFQKARDLFAFYIDLAHSPMDRLGRIAQRVRQRNPGLTFRPIRRRQLHQDLEKVKTIYNTAWADNWGFTPMTNAEFDFLASRLKPLFCEGLVWIAEDHHDPAGFLLAIPDYNIALQPLRGRLLSRGLPRALPYLLGWKYPPLARVITLGVKSQHRGRGLESVMLYEGLQVGAQLGLRGAEASWILEDNLPMRRMLEVFGARAYKTYRIYEQPLP
jgi:GNAT superfamily N-acetyltransferase